MLLTACMKKTDDDAQVLSAYRGMKEQQLYDYGVAAIRDEDYANAIKRFEALDTLYPFSEHIKQAQLFLIFAHFKMSDYAQAAASAGRFIHVYPRDKDVDYAYYMRGVANFEQERGTFAKFFNLDPAWRDPGTQANAYQDFVELTRLFPNSKYYSDAIKRMTYLRNQFAQRELHVANYYFKRGRYVAALERAKYVIKHYQQAPQAKDALQLAKKVNSILHLNQATSDDNTVLKATYS